MQSSPNLKKTTFTLGGAGAIVWGISILAEIITFLAYIAYLVASTPSGGSSFPSLSVSQALLVSDAIIAGCLYVIAAIVLVIVGAKVLKQDLPWATMLAFVLIIAFANLLFSFLLLSTGSDFGVGAGLLASSVLTFVAAPIAWSKSVAAKVTGAVIAMAAVIVFALSYSGPLSLIESASTTTYSLSYLDWSAILTTVSLIVLLVAAICVWLVERMPRVRTIFHTISGFAPLIFGIGLAVGGFGTAGSLLAIPGISGSTCYYCASPSGSIVTVIWTTIAFAILTGIAGILILIGSCVGIAYGATQAISSPAETVSSPVQAVPSQTVAPPMNETTQSEVSNYCPKCGFKLAGDEVFCRKCGTKL